VEPNQATIGPSSAGAAPGIWRAAVSTVQFSASLIVFAALSLFWSIPALALYWLLPRRARNRIGQAAISLGFRIFLRFLEAAGAARVDLAALDRLRDCGPMVIAANHISVLDAVLIVSRLPRAVCISKASLWRNPLLGAGIRLAGYLPNNAPLMLIKSAQHALARGSQLVVFPEGTRGDGTNLGPFKSGFALVAQRAGVPVQTVFLDSNTRYLSKGWPVLRKPAFPMVFRARLGERFAPPETPKVFAGELEAYFRSRLFTAPAA
jgi:1-acyl-sn-glycerol-3-phosphate acyltransferase